MISVYNESKTPWVLRRQNDYVAAQKEKEFVLRTRKSEKPQHARRRIVTALIGNAIIDHETQTMDILNEQMKTFVRTKTVQHVTTAAMKVIFARRTFSPIFIPSDKPDKHLFLGTKELNGKSILAVKTDSSYLLTYFLLDNEFSFILSMNRPGARFVLTLLDKKTKVVTKEIFTLNDEGVVERKVLPPTRATFAQMNEKFTIRRFRPARVTEAVLHHPKDVHLVKKALGDAVGDHTLIPVKSVADLDNIVGKLRNSRYQAVTLFVPVTNRKQDKPTSLQLATLARLQEEFYLVYKLFNDKSIQKLKV